MTQSKVEEMFEKMKAERGEAFSRAVALLVNMTALGQLIKSAVKEERSEEITARFDELLVNVMGTSTQLLGLRGQEPDIEQAAITVLKEHFRAYGFELGGGQSVPAV